MRLLDGLFKKKETEKPTSEKFYTYTKGELIPVAEVSDPTFAEELLGRSVAIKPSENVLYAPADGVMNVVFETKHAVGLVTKSGAEVLFHIGVDTVSLKGEGFSTKVKVGDKVKKGDVLVEFDREFIASKGYDTVVLMIITNSDAYKIFEVNSPGKVNYEEVVFSIAK